MDFANVPVITIDGQYLYKAGERFIVRGIVYEFHTSNPHHPLQDPLDDANYGRVLRDVEAFKELNINTIWVHTHWPNLSHTECMRLLAENGIYVVFELTSGREEFKEFYLTLSYQAEMLNVYCKAIDSIAQYPNTLGACVAKRMITSKFEAKTETLKDAWRLQACLVRDLKTYMRFKNYDASQRVIPLTITDSQWSASHTRTFQYLSDPDVEGRPAGGRIDFYCFVHFDIRYDPYALFTGNPGYPPTSMRQMQPKSSRGLVKMEVFRLGTSESADPDAWHLQLPMQIFEKTEDPIPVLVAEYGSNAASPRELKEIEQLYGVGMNSYLLSRLSGGFVHEFYTDMNNYGLAHNDYENQKHLRILPDFMKFKDAMDAAVGYINVSNLQFYGSNDDLRARVDVLD